MAVLRLKATLSKLITISMISAAVLGLAGCSEKETVDESLYENDIAELEFEIDKEEYKKAFSTYLNEGILECNTENLNKELLSTELIQDVTISASDLTDEELAKLSDDYDPSSGEAEDYEDEGDYIGDDEYPIVDIDGYVIAYGTKQQSDESYKLYLEQPYYQVKSLECYKDRILFKVYNKGSQKTTVYEVKLNENKQMYSYEELGIGRRMQ